MPYVYMMFNTARAEGSILSCGEVWADINASLGETFCDYRRVWCSLVY